MKKYFFKLALIFFVINLLLIKVDANGEHNDNIIFPSWTYYGEIIEHSIIIIISIIAIYLLINKYRKNVKKEEAIKLSIIAFAIIALSQLLTNLHHFLVYPFGVWNAIIHHGLLLVGIILIVFSYIKLLEK